MDDSPRDRLAALEPACDRADALALYDSLPGLAAASLTGRWRGRELATGHPMEGLLEPAGWYGKQFDGPDRVHPLLFARPGGGVFAFDPGRLPRRLLEHPGLARRIPHPVLERGRLLGRLVATDRYRARLRDIAHRGVVSAAMVYDDLPIIDHVRAVDEDTLLGLMDLRSTREPYFFVLSRE